MGAGEVAKTVTPKRIVSNLDALTGVRGLAAWWVVLYHYRAMFLGYIPESVFVFISKGYLAVDLFFVLSGFVIFLNYQSDFRSLGAQAWKKFLVKRIARIYPLHIFLLIAYTSVPLSLLLFAKVDQLPAKFSIGSFVANLFLVQNWYVIERLTWNVPAWSISAEWAAYLLFPIISVTIIRFLDRFVVKVIALFLLLVIIGALFYQLGLESIGSNISKMGVLRCLLQFFIGCVAASFYLQFGHILSKEFPRYFLIIFSVAIFFAYFVTGFPDYFFVSTSFFLLVMYISVSDGVITKFLSFKYVLYVGEISYSTYMLHYLVKDWFKFLFVDNVGGVNPWSIVVCLVVLFVLSVFTHRMIEKPAQRFVTKIGLRWI